MKHDSITVADAVRRIEANRYLLPGIQRSFVWKPTQITALWDSLLRGYPIGSILVWRTTPGASRDLGFRHFVTHAKGTATADELANPSRTTVETVLDGQQRLTALNIGLRGTVATAGVRAQAKELWIDLANVDPQAGSERNMYELAFLTADEAAVDTAAWFPVHAVYRLRRDDQILKALAARGIAQRGRPRATLRELVAAVHETAIPVAVETTPDLDRVLNVFARTNNGGTKLTYVDLLVSTATARWEHRSARDEFRGLQQRVERDAGLRFSIDRFVKAGLLMVSDGEPKLDVETILRGGTERKLEEHWPRIATAIEVAARTLRSFGLSQRTLTSENALIPVAYYAWCRGLRPSYATAAFHARDRALVRAFLARTLLQRGYWTGAVDPVLVASRKAIQRHGGQRFPLVELAKELRPLAGKAIDVDGGLVDELAWIAYGDRRTLLLLRLLFPEVVEHERLDKDHVFPTSRFTEGQLRRAGISPGALEDWRSWANQLPNLQLLDRADNVHKSALLPKEWLGTLDRKTRPKYTQQDLQRLPASLAGFEPFWDRRDECLRARIADLLGVAP